MLCEADKLLAQLCQLCFDESEASRKVHQGSLHSKNQAAFEEQMDPLICGQEEKDPTEELGGPAATQPPTVCIHMEGAGVAWGTAV